jgi:hypothetical protein
MNADELTRILTAERPSGKALAEWASRTSTSASTVLPGGYGLSFLSEKDLGTVAIVRLPASGV